MEDVLEEEDPPVGEGSHLSGETPQAAEQPEFQLLSEIDRLEASNSAAKSALHELQGPLTQLREALTKLTAETEDCSKGIAAIQAIAAALIQKRADSPGPATGTL